MRSWSFKPCHVQGLVTLSKKFISQPLTRKFKTFTCFCVPPQSFITTRKSYDKRRVSFISSFLFSKKFLEVEIFLLKISVNTSLSFVFLCGWFIREICSQLLRAIKNRMHWNWISYWVFTLYSLHFIAASPIVLLLPIRLILNRFWSQSVPLFKSVTSICSKIQWQNSKLALFRFFAARRI